MEVEMVSRCCGAEFVESIDKENDLETSEDYVCCECQDYCDIQTDYDYRELMLYDIAEAREDDKRCGL